MPMIDHIDLVEVEERLGLNELMTLDCLSAGLNALAHQVRMAEQPLIEMERERGKRIMAYGFGFLPAESELMIPCFFHWFGTSVCNYARLVGFLKGLSTGAFSREEAANPAMQKDLVKAYCTNYVNSIRELEPILVWRRTCQEFCVSGPHS